MDVNSLDADFLAYRERGDVDALVRVFDAAAPRLLLLAAHLVARADEAEDLVQATFLAALRDARDFGGERPVLAWLAGILRHRALDLGRRKNVRAEHSLADVDEAHEPVAPERSPIEFAQDTEAFERVVAAIASLEAPYRELLTLRLVHGLDPAAIAHARGANPSTVRVQLKRGLERLRAALPDPSALLGAGFAALVVGEHTRGLAAVRDHVLAGVRTPPTAVASTAAAAPVVATGAAWSTIGVLAAMLAVVVAVVLLVKRAPPTAPPIAPLASSPVVLAEPHSESVVTTKQLLEEVGYLDARSPTTPTADAHVDGAAVTTVRGVLTHHDGSSVVGAVGTLGAWNNVDGHSTGPDVLHVTTGPDGSFAIPFELLTDHQYALEFDVAGGVDPSWRWAPRAKGHELPGGGELDLGTTQLPRGCALTVRIVDGAGAVIAQAFQIDIVSTWRPSSAGASQCDWWLDTTSGEVVVPDVPYGDLRVSAKSELGHALHTRRFIDSDACVVELVHVDPAADGRVHVVARERVSKLHMVQAPPAGAFTLVDQQGKTHVARASSSDMYAYDFERLDAETYTLHFADAAYTAQVTPGVVPGQRVQVALSPSVSVALSVVSGATGEVVSDARVVAAIRTDTASSWFAQLGAATPSLPTWNGGIELQFAESDGSATRIVHTLPNAQVWDIIADGFAPHAVAFENGFAPGEHVAVAVVLQPPTTLRGRVLRANGSPVGGATVTARGAQPLPPGTDVWEVTRDYINRVQSVPRFEAHTDDEGRFEFSGLADVPHDVVVEVAKGVMAFGYDVLASSDDFELVLPPAGSLRGRLTAETPCDFTKCVVELERLPPLNETRLAHLVPSMHSISRLVPNVQADGSFAIDWIPAGAREVTVRLPQVVSHGSTWSTSGAGPVLERRTVEFVEGRDEWLAADLSAHVPTTVRVTIDVVGERDAGLDVVAYGTRPGFDDEGLATSGALDADGNAQLASVYPGTWDFFLHGSNGTWSVEIARAVVVAASDLPELASSVTLARGRVEFVDANGAPFANGSLEKPRYGRGGAKSGSVAGKLDAAGGIELLLPIGSHPMRVSKGTALDADRVFIDVVVEWTAEGPATARITVP